MSKKFENGSFGNSYNVPRSAVGLKAKKKPIGERFWEEAMSIGIVRQIILIMCVIFFFYAINPLFLGVFNVGIIPLVCIDAFAFAVTLKWDSIINETRPAVRGVYIAVAVVVCAGMILISAISGVMISASLKKPPEGSTRVTVVVLGCLVRDDGPSLMLKDRLDTAADYLLSNPEACCVVTGGQGENEPATEASVMKKYLVEKGVSATRIVEEDKSESTYENILFAKEKIKEYNCHEDMIIVTDRFHQYRAQLAAGQAGVTSYALSVETRWYLTVQYWMREVVGICYIWMFGNR